MSFLNQKNLIYFTILITPLYLVRFEIFHLPTNLLELFIILNFIFWLYSKRKDGFKIDYNSLPWQIIVSIGLIFLGIILSIFTNDAIVIGLGILKSWLVLPLIFAYILYTTIENKLEIERVFLSIYLSASFVAIISLFYKLFNLTTFDGRLSSFYLSPNYLAMYLAPAVLVGFYFFIKTFSHKETKPAVESFPLPLINSGWGKFLTSSSLTVILLTLFFTYSYGAWFAVFLSIGIASFFYFPKKHFFIILISTFFFFFSFLTFQFNSQKFSSLLNFSERSSLASRLMIWKVSERLIIENPILGIGPGNFQKKYLSLQPLFPLYLEWAVPQPHNIFLAFWLESGILGLVGFVFLLYFVFYSLFKRTRGMNLSFILFSFFLYFIIHGMFDTLFWKNDLALVFWIFITIFLKTYNETFKEN